MLGRGLRLAFSLYSQIVEMLVAPKPDCVLRR